MTWIDEIDVVFPIVPKVFAQVTKGNKPVLGAAVTADIIGPNTKTTITLKDDGANPDVFREDGVYSGYIAGVDGNNRYQVISYVRNSRKTRVRRRKQKIQIGKRRKRTVVTDEVDDNWLSEETEDGFEEEAVMPFERVNEAGVFKVQGWAPDIGDIQAPAAVSDLRIVSVRDDTVTLAWTSPGDDIIFGNATWIYLKGSPIFNEIRTGFDMLGTSEDTSMVGWTLEPVPAGEIQYHTVQIPEVMRQIKNVNNQSSLQEISDSFFFALKAFDEVNNTADLSNIVNAVFFKEPVVETTSSTVTVPPIVNITALSDFGHKAETNVKENEANSSILVIGIILGVVLTVAVLIAVGFYMRKKRIQYNVVAMSEVA